MSTIRPQRRRRLLRPPRIRLRRPSCRRINSRTSSPTQGANPGTQGGANFLFDPGQITAAKGNTFVVNLLISGAQNVYSVPVQLNYDPAKLQLVNISNGGFLSQDGQAVALVHREDDTTGTLADYGHAAAGRGWSFRTGRGGHDDISGEGQRTDSSDHYSGRSARSRPSRPSR